MYVPCSNRFLHVINLGVPGIRKIDWDGLAKLAHNGVKGDKKDSTSTKTLVLQGANALHKLVLWLGFQNLVRSREQMMLALLRQC
jgi:hypothetical protein